MSPKKISRKNLNFKVQKVKKQSSPHKATCNQRTQSRDTIPHTPRKRCANGAQWKLAIYSFDARYIFSPRESAQAIGVRTPSFYIHCLCCFCFCLQRHSPNSNFFQICIIYFFMAKALILSIGASLRPIPLFLTSKLRSKELRLLSLFSLDIDIWLILGNILK